MAWKPTTCRFVPQDTEMPALTSAVMDDRGECRPGDQEEAKQMYLTSEADGTADAPQAAATQKDRALHVLVPERAIVHARHAALDSMPRMPFRHFIAQLLLQAKPIISEELGSFSSEQGSPPAVAVQHASE